MNCNWRKMPQRPDAYYLILLRVHLAILPPLFCAFLHLSGDNVRCCDYCDAKMHSRNACATGLCACVALGVQVCIHRCKYLHNNTQCQHTNNNSDNVHSPPSMLDGTHINSRYPQKPFSASLLFILFDLANILCEETGYRHQL